MAKSVHAPKTTKPSSSAARDKSLKATRLDSKAFHGSRLQRQGVKGKKRGGAAKRDEDDFEPGSADEEEDEASDLSEAPEGDSDVESGAGDAELEDDGGELLVIDRPEKSSKKTKGRKSTGGATSNKENGPAPLDDSLPPLVDLGDIFKDLVGNVQEPLAQLVDVLGDRALRVGTMCSGTESPLLALGLISNALKDLTGKDLKVEHIFSCEIEPFKQAYIERNFAPPLLFRDVTELGEDEALTAYGGRAAVPGNIDMLVAGTSCVDYSPLNTKKKTIDARGESGRTFFGMMDYVVKHKPTIVILENVSGAPWDEVVDRFDKIDYSATFIRLDTKHYYIPHTRSRGYLLAIPKQSGRSIVHEWSDKVKALSRPASAPLEAFLLSTDDPRIHRARQELAIDRQNKDGTKRATVDWIRCESRHAQARDQEMLGLGRPLTAWQDNGGAPTMPDGAWNDWASVQTERVLDLMDISYLRLALKGTDVSYKSALWNLSQNVDRTTASVKLGICPCLTPNMIPYLASRGGPIVGLEALALQGLPIDELLLTRENTDQLADLAGNAMSSTVVGAAILAALSLAKDQLAVRGSADEDTQMTEPPPEAASVESHIRGLDKLVEHTVDLGAFDAPSADIFERASRSARKCVCEGRNETSQLEIYQCTSCAHTSCAACRGRPLHHYAHDTTERLAPTEFEAELKQVLPMRFKLSAFSLEALRNCMENCRLRNMPVVEADQEGLEAYLRTVSDAVNQQEFHFQQVTRRSNWIATFNTERARLELHLGGLGASWRLFVLPEPSLPVGDALRKRLAGPVARLNVDKNQSSLVDGAWEFAAPIQPTADLKACIETIGELVPSWRSELGLVPFVDEKRPARLRVTCSAELAQVLDRTIDGEYQLENDCGTACNSLYRRTESTTDSPLYLFLDPTRSGEPCDDPFVFAEGCAKLEYEQTRHEVALLAKSWRPPTNEGSANVAVEVPSHWTVAENTKIDHSSAASADASFALLPGKFDLNAGAGSCAYADCLLSASVRHTASVSLAQWSQPEWHEVNLQHEGTEVFSKIAWMMARIPKWDTFRDWQTIPEQNLHTDCPTCCPPEPTIHWIKRTEQKPKSVVTSIVAVEDGLQAAAFEKALKARPSALLVHTRQSDDVFHFRVGLNVATLAHRALGALPNRIGHGEDIAAASIAWRLRSASAPELTLGRDNAQTAFTLPSNRADVPAAQPPHFVKQKLRPEQLRSLTWMIAQETNPQPWVEEEVAEAALPQVGWHAEARASREVKVRGGVVADEVGYGKTAITIGLISSRLKDVEMPEVCDRIPVKASLVVIPPWPSEIAKFTEGAAEGGLKVITIKDVADLKRNTIQDIQEADVVVIADSVFKSPIGDWSASKRGVKYDQRAGRYFRVCVEESLEALPAQVRLLRAPNGPKKVLAAINEARKARSKKQDVVIEPSKRLKGQAALFAQEKAAFIAKNGGKAKATPVPAKQKFETKFDVPADPWDLGSAAVHKDWTRMRSPPLAMFKFARLIVDEFTYSAGPQLAAIHSVDAGSRWILSGTPPLKSFGEIKTIANLLHVHLGIDDDSEGGGPSRDARLKEKTAAEQFHSFRDVHTAGWHRRRDEIAQNFLNQFARQNIAEIDEIPYSEELIKIDLPAAEMAIYRELEHHLLALAADLGKIQKIKKEKKGDREVRLSQALGESKSPEEALLKRCSHFSLDMDEETAALQDAPHVCDMIVARRTAQLDECIQQVTETMHTTAVQHRYCEKHSYYNGQEGTVNADVRHFKEFVRSIFTAVKDEEANAALHRIAERVGCKNGKIGPTPENLPAPRNMSAFLRQNGDPIREMDSEGRLTTIPGKKVSREEFGKSKTWIVRQNVSMLQRLVKELVGRYRSKRYFECVRSAQRNEDALWDGVAILSSCGHKGPLAEVQEAATKGKCISPSCDARVGTSNIVLGSSLGVEAESGSFGVKLETLVNLILDEIPKDDKILVFCQFDDLFDKVLEALETYGIPTAVLSGTATSKGKILEKFQNPHDQSDRVLLLRVTDASASGANLTVANWAFFISPLLTESKQQYKAFETQAIGRLRRYGQLNKVKIFRLLTDSTIDVDIYEERLDSKVDEVMSKQAPRQLKFGHRERTVHGVARKTTSAAPKKGKGINKVAIVDDADELEEEAAISSESEAELSGSDTSDDEVPTNKLTKPKLGSKSADSDAGLKENVASRARPKRASTAAALAKTMAILQSSGTGSDSDATLADETDDASGSEFGGDNGEIDRDTSVEKEVDGMQVDDESSTSVAGQSTVANTAEPEVAAAEPNKRPATDEAGKYRFKKVRRPVSQFLGVFVHKSASVQVPAP
ncbi:hypothetical protein OIV83_006035 [Microbotryomycetes sp. JL201]|nr:hypothetical protein OIV83_006035 [Microbotryomycetes sp. JL201]